MNNTVSDCRFNCNLLFYCSYSTFIWFYGNVIQEFLFYVKLLYNFQKKKHCFLVLISKYVLNNTLIQLVEFTNILIEKPCQLKLILLKLLSSGFSLSLRFITLKQFNRQLFISSCLWTIVFTWKTRPLGSSKYRES